MLRLTDYMKKPADVDMWSPSNVLGALLECLNDKVCLISELTSGVYQGEYYALLYIKSKKVFFLWRSDFGSCEYCDSYWAAVNKYEYVKATLAEGNTRQFKTLNEVLDYLKNTTDPLWMNAGAFIYTIKEYMNQHDTH